jgi:hypothetical protein
MKRATVLTLAVLFFLSAFIWIPQLSSAREPADLCFDDWQACRTRAFESEQGIIRTTLWLTVCDLALGKCLLRL